MKLDDFLLLVDDDTKINIFIYGICLYSGFKENYKTKQKLLITSISVNDDTMTIKTRSY